LTRIQTSRLELRLARPSDADDLHRLEQDPEVMRHLNGGQPTSRMPVDPAASLFRMPRGHDHDVWVVIIRASGTLTGWVAMHVDDATGELGYRFFREYWGQGYASEAARALVAETFEQRSVTRVIAETMQRNVASRRVLEKLGMRLVTTRPAELPGTWPDGPDHEVVYSVARKDWGS
jgi:RimJ/RimL family protein N-acetyltransferase